jgi:hypothetical protein
MSRIVRVAIFAMEDAFTKLNVTGVAQGHSLAGLEG